MGCTLATHVHLPLLRSPLDSFDPVYARANHMLHVYDIVRGSSAPSLCDCVLLMHPE